MLLILAIALLPLGLIAIFASRESAHVNQLRHEAEVRAMATAGAVTITDTIRPPTYALRQTMDDLLQGSQQITAQQCDVHLARLLARNGGVRAFAIYRPDGTRICATADRSDLQVYSPADGGSYDVRLSAEKRRLRTIISTGPGGYFGIAEFDALRLTKAIRATEPPATANQIGLVLRQGGQAIALSSAHSDNPLAEIVSVSAPVAGGQLSLEMRMPANRVGALEVLLILLPILMWAAGAIIGWLVVERLLLHPLHQMRRAVAAFNEGKGPLILPRLTTPAHEIRELGQSLSDATRALKQHEQELAEGLARQKLLTREVHHRVKNNLQVVSSLINLHARGSRSEAVAEAYASIQRRVDALAVVHRNYYAELEENHGVSLRTLISELASNLRASATTASNQASISLNLISAHASQDAAVPVAFLVTEIVELAMETQHPATIAISLAPIAGESGKALLSIASPALATASCREGQSLDRFRRIVDGLARQLRAPLEHDPETGRYAIRITIREDAVDAPGR